MLLTELPQDELLIFDVWKSCLLGYDHGVLAGVTPYVMLSAVAEVLVEVSRILLEEKYICFQNLSKML